MGRRSVDALDPVRSRELAAKQLRTLLSHYDLAEFEAQIHAADMVTILAGFAKDATQAPDFRRQCANDVLDRAYGRPATKATVTIVDPSAKNDAGSPVREEIEATRVTAEAYQELDDLVRRKVPPEQWPERIRALAGEAIAYYAGESSSGET